MANSDTKFGLRPYKPVSGGAMGRLGGYNIAYNYATGLYIGDLVALSGTGREIIIAPEGTATQAIGVFAGCEYVSNDNVMMFGAWPGVALADSTKVVKCSVFDDPMTEFVTQITTVAAADIGLGFGWTKGTPNTTTGRSGGYIDAADTDDQLIVVGLSEGPDGIVMSDYGAFAKVRCRIAVHPRGGTIAAVT